MKRKVLSKDNRLLPCMLTNEEFETKAENAETWQKRHEAGNVATMPLALQASIAGWQTPTSPVNTDGHQSGNNRFVTYTRNALAGWPTTRSTDGEKGNRTNEGAYREAHRRRNGYDLPTAAQLTGRATPTVQDAENNAAPSEFNRNSDPLNVQAVKASGQTQSSSPAETGKRGVLNPALARWLMGYPEGWDCCGVTGIALCLKRRRSS